MFAPINYFSTSRGLETSDSNNGQWEHDFFSNWRRMSNIEFVQRNFEVTWRKLKTNVTSLRLLWRILRYIFSRCLRGGRRMMLLCWSRLLLSERHVQEMSQLPLSFSNDRSTYFTEGNVTYAHAESCHFEERTKTRQWDYLQSQEGLVEWKTYSSSFISGTDTPYPGDSLHAWEPNFSVGNRGRNLMGRRNKRCCLSTGLASFFLQLHIRKTDPIRRCGRIVVPIRPHEIREAYLHILLTSSMTIHLWPLQRCFLARWRGPQGVGSPDRMRGLFLEQNFCLLSCGPAPVPNGRRKAGVGSQS